jgi:predicted Zn-dependent protease
LIERAVASRPDDAGLWFLLAQVDDVRANYAAAAEKLERVVQAKPDDRAAHVLLARAYAKLKMREEFQREKAIIEKLTQAEQERNLLKGEAYRGSSGERPASP